MQAAVETRISKVTLSAALAVWFAAVFAVSYGGGFIAPGGMPPGALIGAVLIPVLAFGGAYRLSLAFREMVHALDLRAVVLIHMTRLIGALFLFLLSRNLLPAYFALPAGWGDVTAAVLAPFAWWALQSPARWGKRAFIAWSVFGLADFAVAVSMGGLYPALPGGPQPGEVTAILMQQFPLSLIPGFAVPFLTICHLIALIQVRGRSK